MSYRYIHRAPAKRLIIPGSAGVTATDWPGLPGGNNPVGHVATPSTAPAAFTSQYGTWPGAWPSGFANAGFTETLPAYLTRTSQTLGGSAGTPQIIKFVDFNGGANSGAPNYSANPAFITADGTSGGATANYVTFVGCRFSSNACGTNSLNVNVFGNNIAFFYCTFAPLPSLHTSPPRGPLGTAWPSASANTGINTSSANYASYCTPASDSYQFVIDPELSIVTMDHCDCWGFGGGINLKGKAAGGGNILGPQIFTDNWFHDYANCVTFPVPGQSTNYHTDGLGYPSGGVAPVFASGGYVLCKHNTWATLGNTEFICFQETATGAKLNGTTAAWNSAFTWASGQQVFDTSDGNLYHSLTGVNTTTPPHSDATNWAPDGPGNYHHIHIINNYFSGQIRAINIAHGLQLSSDLICTDNVIGTDLAMQYFIYGPGAPYDATALYKNPYASSNGNVWKNNRIVVVPGDTWSSSGSLQWNNLTAYIQGAVIMGSDNNVYQCIASGGNTGTNPVGNPSVWQMLTTTQRANGFYVWPNNGLANFDWTY